MSKYEIKAIVIAVLAVLILGGGGILVHRKIAHKKETKIEVKDDFLKIPDYTKDEGIKTVASPPKPIDTGDVSYWFVVVQKDNGTMMNTFIQQNHKGFSVSEAKAEFKGNKVFILNFIQVSKETWDINN